MMKRLIVIALIASQITGCMVGPKYRRPGVTSPDVFRADPRSQPDASSLSGQKWSEVFNDPQLQTLIRAALERNYDLRLAVARISQAEASLGITRADQYPTFDTAGGITGRRPSTRGLTALPSGSGAQRAAGSLTFGLLSFEADLWGRLRRATEAARAELLATEEARRAVIVSLVGTVAAAYFDLRELDLELEIARRTLALRQESLRIIKLRKDAGIATRLELRQAEQLALTTAAAIPNLEQLIEQQENFINLLLGQNPGPVARGKMLVEQETPAFVPPGLPSALLERRPDIRGAEQELIAANADIGVAKAAYFPQISLTGSAGGESAALVNLFSGPARIWSFVGQAAQPIFNAGRLKSRVKLAEAGRQFALTTYEQTIRTAFREVSDALIANTKVKEIRAQREALAATLRDRAHLSDLRYRGGVASYLDKLDAERDLFAAELDLARIRRDELLTVVQLYRALGGGWE
ncbi:MAG: efflux transporter outer membrane subunit [Blastocatellales bacterium]